tara:strand:- start:1847 stop:3004 length:1158 start_codon:yes stop_codon:yes gene_type:complete
MAKRPNLAMIPAGYKSRVLYSAIPEEEVGDFAFERTGVGTRVNSDGLIVSMASQLPRLNYDLTNNVASRCPHFLLEPARTNLIHYSNNFAGTGWGNTDATLTANTTSSPDGTLNASTLKATSAGGFNNYNATGASSTSHTVSIYIKRKTGTGQVQLYGPENAYQDITVTSDWTRFDFTATSTTTAIRIGVKLAVSGDEVFLFGAQAEAGLYATTYIPTDGGTATRAIETAINSGSAATFNSESGILFAEIAALTRSAETSYLGLSDGTNNNVVLLGYTSTLNRITAFCGGTDDVTINYASTDKRELHKCAVSYQNNKVKFWVNGSQVGSTETTFGIFAVNTLNTLRFDYGDGSNDFFGKCKDLRVYDTDGMSDTEIDNLLTEITI